jgi:hypothetical protein
MMISVQQGNHFSNLSRLSVLRPPPRWRGGTLGAQGSEFHLQVIPADGLLVLSSLLQNLARFAHPPEAENDGKMEHWKIGPEWHRIEKYEVMRF